MGATTDVRELAGTITQAVNFNNEMPALLTIGAPSINQAVKGIAAAASDLRGGQPSGGGGPELTFQPAFRHVNRTKPLIAFYLSRQKFHDRLDTGEVVELTATANQKIVALAGAIAGKVRHAASARALLPVPFSGLAHIAVATGGRRPSPCRARRATLPPLLAAAPLSPSRAARAPLTLSPRDSSHQPPRS